MKASIRQFVVYILVGALISSALIAVAAIMTGGFSDTIIKMIWTLVIVMLHSLVGLIVIWGRGDESGDDNKTLGEVLPMASDTLLYMTLVSTATAIAGIWGMDGDVVGKLYASYFIFVFVVAQSEALLKMRNLSVMMSRLVMSAVAVALLAANMLVMAVWLEFEGLPEWFTRSLSSLGVIDGTLTLLAIIGYVMHLKKHPKTKRLFGPNNKAHRSSVGRIIIIIFILLFVLPTVFSLFFSLIFGLTNF